MSDPNGDVGYCVSGGDKLHSFVCLQLWLWNAVMIGCTFEGPLCLECTCVHMCMCNASLLLHKCGSCAQRALQINVNVKKLNAYYVLHVFSNRQCSVSCLATNSISVKSVRAHKFDIRLGTT